MKSPKTPAKGGDLKKVKNSGVIKGKNQGVAAMETSRKDRPGGRPNLKSKPLTAKESNQKKKIKRQRFSKSKNYLQKVEENTSRFRLEKKDSALKYLAAWTTRTQGSKWKFNKSQQKFLISNMYDKNMLSTEDFDLLVEYLKDLKGARRTDVLENAQVIYKNNTSALENADKDAIPKDAKAMCKRSRKLIETLV